MAFFSYPVPSWSKASVMALLSLTLISEVICTQRSVVPRVKQSSPSRFVKSVGEDEVKLVCHVKNAQTYAWYKDGKQVTPTFEPARYTVKPDRYLRITDVVKSDSGRFVCVTTNSYGSANCTIRFLVEGDKPAFSDPNMLKRAFRAWPASHTIRLKCKANGAPPLKYSWLKDGQRMSRRMDPFLNSSLWYLTLKDLWHQDSGRYTCIVTNPYGSINHTYTLRVIAKPRSRPILAKNLPRNATVQIGGNTTMKCIVLVSGTLPDFRWLKWNKSVTSVPKINDNLEHGSHQLIDPHYYKTIQVGKNYGVELRITDVTEDDFGLYTCFVSNHIGTDYKSAFLSSYVKPTSPADSKGVQADGNVPQNYKDTAMALIVTPTPEASGNERGKPGNKKSWTSKIQYPWVLIGVSAAVITALIMVSFWFCWKLNKARAHARSPRPDIASLQPKYEVQNEYVVVPNFN